MKYFSVTVVVPVYNRCDLLRRCLFSIVNQTYKDFEVIVVDDASTNDIKSVVAGFNDSRIIYLRQNINIGVSAARNIGIKAARGRNIAFLDSDDLWLPDALMLLAGHATAMGDLFDCVYSVVYREELAGRHYTPGLFFNKNDLLSNLRSMCCIHLQGSLIRRQCFERIGYFDENLRNLEDWDMFLRLASTCTMHFLPKLTAISRCRDGGLSTSRGYLLYGKDYLLNKHKLLFNDKSKQADFFFGMGHILCAYDCVSDGRVLLRMSAFRGHFKVNRILAYIVSFFGCGVYSFVARVWNFLSFCVLFHRYGLRR